MGTCQHGDANTWLYGTVAPASGDRFTLIVPNKTRRPSSPTWLAA